MTNLSQTFDDSPMNKSFDFAKAPGHLVRRAQQIAVALFMAELAKEDVTPVQFAILNAVMDIPGIDQITLAGRYTANENSRGACSSKFT